MTVRNKVVVVPGAAHGIDAALARRFAVEGARTVVVADIDGQGAQTLAAENAGIFIDDGVNTPAATWKRILEVDVMVHIYAARVVLPGMLARREGYLLQTVSAAGLHRRSKATVFFWQRKLHGHRRLVCETGRQRTWYAGVVRIVCVFDFYLWW
jgi:NADP-dependent 3-hydroxy acid dehydrogenase YdfG